MSSRRYDSKDDSVRADAPRARKNPVGKVTLNPTARSFTPSPFDFDPPTGPKKPATLPEKPSTLPKRHHTLPKKPPAVPKAMMTDEHGELPRPNYAMIAYQRNKAAEKARVAAEAAYQLPPVYFSLPVPQDPGHWAQLNFLTAQSASYPLTGGGLASDHAQIPVVQPQLLPPNAALPQSKPYRGHCKRLSEASFYAIPNVTVPPKARLHKPIPKDQFPVQYNNCVYTILCPPKADASKTRSDRGHGKLGSALPGISIPPYPTYPALPSTPLHATPAAYTTTDWNTTDWSTTAYTTPAYTTPAYTTTAWSTTAHTTPAYNTPTLGIPRPTTPPPKPVERYSTPPSHTFNDDDEFYPGTAPRFKKHATAPSENLQTPEAGNERGNGSPGKLSVSSAAGNVHGPGKGSRFATYKGYAYY
ncbi:hypothetical protein Cob_v009550 [Colletotrichum orbiculare MAFF 240422]|uniref:Uncharacterized protein n=1 Tax=Colletotrichum orbiculare (strain 104-T / ATCC 96160 / CBS 514.97 / LARS 414 / MAFF 240422) TaxID=1213857 RepID=N4V4I0_COLOR|nr:hypothetical protein Cob_v009550 [Colletotrichum orbiculare MAFF 240422]